MTILGRLQPFAENTITAIIPLWHNPDLRRLLAVLRLWSTVFAANLVGTFVAAAFPAEIRHAVGEIELHMTGNSATEIFVEGIPAGILIAAIVCVMPSAGASALSRDHALHPSPCAGRVHACGRRRDRGELSAAYRPDRPGRGTEPVPRPGFRRQRGRGTLAFRLFSYAQVRREKE